MSALFVYRMLFVLALAAGAAGCGQRTLDLQKTYPVSGKLTMKGEPVAFAIIYLNPREGMGAKGTGYTGADGTYSVRTFSSSEMDGAVPGEYEVEIEGYYGPTFMGPQPQAGEKPTPIPPEMRKPGTVVVIEANDNQVNIDL
jgi:hypothetical protein